MNKKFVYQVGNNKKVTHEFERYVEIGEISFNKQALLYVYCLPNTYQKKVEFVGFVVITHVFNM
jgi:hypothetical protein